MENEETNSEREIEFGEEREASPNGGRSKDKKAFRRIKDLSDMVSELREGDGIDPRTEHRQRQRMRTEGKPDYAAARLAAQISRCISGNLGTGNLADFEVQSVTPGKGNNFIVTLCASDPSCVYDLKQVQEAATALLPILRAELAQDIHRKKVPNLSIRVMPPGFGAEK